jgi:cAMP-specific phosphodiesterase 4
MLEMQLLLKCADLSNTLRPLGEARRWAARVTDEMFAQGDRERAGGLDVTGTCDRRTQSRVGLQVGFIDAVAGPFLRGLAGRYPGLGGLVRQLEENRRGWETCTDEGLLAEVGAAAGYPATKLDLVGVIRCKSGVNQA